MVENSDSLDLVFAYVDGTSTRDQDVELVRRLRREPELADHLAAQSMITSMLETMGRQHSEEDYLRRTVLPAGRPTILPWVAAAAAVLIAAAGLFFYFAPRDSEVSAPETPAVTEREIAPAPVPEETPKPEASAAALADGPVLFEETFDGGLEGWRISKASEPFVTVEQGYLVLDTLGRKDVQAAIAPKKKLRAASLSIEYDYRVSEEGSGLCPFFGFVVAKPAAMKGIQSIPVPDSPGTAGGTEGWTRARFELFGLKCPKAGPFVWVKKFEDKKLVSSYYVPCGMKDLRIGTFWAIDVRAEVDNIAIRKLAPLRGLPGR